MLAWACRRLRYSERSTALAILSTSRLIPRNLLTLCACSAGCAIDESGCAARCGNDVVEAGEDCDDGIFNDDSAPDACRTTCRFPTCGDAVADSGEDCDGTDLAGEDCTDYGWGDASLEALDGYRGTGQASAVLSGRLSYVLGLQGPARG